MKRLLRCCSGEDRSQWMWEAWRVPVLFIVFLAHCSFMHLSIRMSLVPHLFIQCIEACKCPPKAGFQCFPHDMVYCPCPDCLSAFPALTAPFNGKVGCSHCVCWDSMCDYLLSNSLLHHVSPLAKSALGVLYILYLIKHDEISHGHLMKAEGLQSFQVGEHLEVLGGRCSRMARVCSARLLFPAQCFSSIWRFLSCIHYNTLVIVGKVLF